MLLLPTARLPPGPLRPRVSDPHFSVWNPTPCGCGKALRPRAPPAGFPERLYGSESPGARQRPTVPAPAAVSGLGNPQGPPKRWLPQLGVRGTRGRAASSPSRAKVQTQPALSENARRRGAQDCQQGVCLSFNHIQEEGQPD